MDWTPNPKAISALLPHAISLDQFGDQEMVDTLFHLSRTSTPFLRQYVEQYTITLLSKPTPPSLNRATVLLSTYVPQHYWDECVIARWAAAVSAVPYSEKVGWSVVGTLLQLASTKTLRPYIPVDIWAWLKKQPSLPPVCRGRATGTKRGTVCHVRGLGDPDTLKSYLLLVWSEWNTPDSSGFAEMQVSIMEDLSGIGMQHHRLDLINRLDHILGELGRGLVHLRHYKPLIGGYEMRRRKERYRALKEVLLQVERKAMKLLTGMSHIGWL
jgi:hypothetical protein